MMLAMFMNTAIDQQVESFLVREGRWEAVKEEIDRRLGAGGVNFESSFAALREIGYDSYLIVELPPKADDAGAVARHSIEFLEEALNG